MQEIIEEWRPVAGFEHYKVSSLGRVMNAAGMYLKPQPHYKGHLKVTLYDKGRFSRLFVHRLVAIAFIPNPENLPIVNHKNMNKQYNSVSNLEWATVRENTQHYYDHRGAEVNSDIPF